MREYLRRFLAWGVGLSLVLPMVALVMLGLGSLLASLGDGVGAAACNRVGLAAAAIWFMALATTATAGGLVAFEVVSRGAPPGGVPSDKPAKDPGT